MIEVQPNNEISTSESENTKDELNKNSKKIKKISKKQQQDIQANKANLLLEWRDNLKKKIKSSKKIGKETYQIVEIQNSIKEINLDKYTQDVHGIFINLNWIDEKKCLKQIKEIEISDKLIKNGIIFVWTEKEYISDVVKMMEEKHFVYVENFQAVILNQSKAEQVVSNSLSKVKKKAKQNKINQFFGSAVQNNNNNVNNNNTKNNDDLNNLSKVTAVEIFDNSKYTYFRKAKKILFMFRKQLPKTQLELRHQRTSDSIFTLLEKQQMNILQSDRYLKEFVYNLIETLLPKAAYQKDQSFKLIELFSDNEPREGWLKVYLK